MAQTNAKWHQKVNGTKDYLRFALALENFEPHPGDMLNGELREHQRLRATHLLRLTKGSVLGVRAMTTI